MTVSRAISATINGVAWDHRRCWGPLIADAEVMRVSGGPRVDWRKRSLFSFGEGDLESYCDVADLVIFDHPFTGDVARRGLMHDLTAFLTSDDLAMFETNEVGKSFRSYQFEGGQYGIPVDAAATTAAWRADLLDEVNLSVPKTFEDVLAVGIEARRYDKWIAWAAKPTDLFCAYVAISASLGHEAGQTDDSFVPRDLNAEIISRIMKLREVIHPNSFKWNPIQLFDYMTSHDDVLYTPYAFNYVNYTTHEKRALTFGAPPRHAKNHSPRGLLGGAGIGISTRAGDPQRAFDYAMRLISPKFQASDYVVNGGQPGMRSAWLSSECDQMTNGFFSNCLETMDGAYLRPNIPGFVPFFHEATIRLAHVVNDGAPRDQYWQWQTETYEELKNGRTATGK